jgi:hypothetical protein
MEARFMSARRLIQLTLLAACAAGAPVHAADTFGAGVTAAEVTPLSTVIARPADYEGKTIRVDGVVTAVCTHMGCWMALAPDASGAPASAADTMMIKVDDGVIVFPVSAKGKRASAQGVVQKVGGDAEGQSAAREHAAAGGQSEQPASWQIKATGAVVY